MQNVHLKCWNDKSHCLLLDWNHSMSDHAVNFYFYLWLLKNSSAWEYFFTQKSTFGVHYRTGSPGQLGLRVAGFPGHWVAGSQNVIQCYVNSLQVANGPASLWASADETANTSPRRAIGPKAAGFPAKSRLQDGRPPFARRPRRRRSLSTTVQMRGTDSSTVASLLRHFPLPCLRCPKREEKINVRRGNIRHSTRRLAVLGRWRHGHWLSINSVTMTTAPLPGTARRRFRWRNSLGNLLHTTRPPRTVKACSRHMNWTELNRKPLKFCREKITHVMGLYYLICLYSEVWLNFQFRGPTPRARCTPALTGWNLT